LKLIHFIPLFLHPPLWDIIDESLAITFVFHKARRWFPFSIIEIPLLDARSSCSFHMEVLTRCHQHSKCEAISRAVTCLDGTFWTWPSWWKRGIFYDWRTCQRVRLENEIYPSSSFFFLTAIPFHLSLRDYNGRPQYVCSILAVVCQLLMFIPKENYSKVNLRLFPYIVALSSSHHHGIRLISHIVLLRTLRRIKDESLNAGGINEGSLNTILETMYDYLSKNKDCQKWIEKFQSSVPSKNPVLEGLELAEIMCKQRFENGQLLRDWVPLYVFERLSSFDEIECLLNSFMNGKNTRR